MSSGGAPPVVLVHGMASSFDLNWRRTGLADLLADAGREVVPVDLLGHGSAPAPHDPAAYADLTARVVEVLPGGPVDAVGFSLGAHVLLEAARDEPGRFGRLVLGGVGDTLLGPQDREPLARALEAGDPGAPGILGLFVRLAEGSGTDPLALAALLRRPTAPLTTADLARVTCPVLLVLGDRDHAWPADQLAAALPDARIKALKGVDHFATPTDFGFLDATLEFLGATS
jgi:pimeloyl-ACP methyl ester carboxylesterase